MPYTWDFSAVLAYWPAWIAGATTTLIYAVGTIAGGLVIGLLCGSAMLLDRRWLSWLVDGYVQFFRCTPLVVQIVWFYYALPVVLRVNLPPWLAAGLGLTLYMGAFSTEIFRAGVMSIDRGQWHASRALGMTYVPMMRHIILPQAARRMLPPFVNQCVLQLKNTSLLYVVAVPDLMFTSSTIVSDTFRPFETYTGVALIYFVMLYPAVKLAKLLEQRADV